MCQRRRDGLNLVFAISNTRLFLLIEHGVLLLALVFVYVRDECVFCRILFLPGHMNQVVEAGEVGVLIDNRLRLLVLQRHEFVAGKRELTYQAVLDLTEWNVREALLRGRPGRS
jgi:hypothetical protein